MTPFAQKVDVAADLGRELIAADFGPFYGTPCGILSPLHQALDEQAGVLTISREDNAVGIAAGASLTGRSPVVLMQNGGLGPAVSAIASLVVPYRIPLLLVVSLREADPDQDCERTILRELTMPLLDGLGVQTFEFHADAPVAVQVESVRESVRGRHRPAALLIPPTSFELPA
ncbi:hypothetical protein [Actinokineospora sp.]|uniref:hypothetical protein n=1 Tax=Actinokineospora sp. TaxID=1872133 RepID=UPI004037D4FF